MRVFGVNVLAVLAAGAAFWVLGFVWYGLLFDTAWMGALAITEADYEGSSRAWMGLGVVIALLSAFALAAALGWGGTPSLGEALKRTFVLWLGLGLTAALYVLAYQPAHSLTLVLIDGGYTLVGWMIAAAIIALLR